MTGKAFRVGCVLSLVLTAACQNLHQSAQNARRALGIVEHVSEEPPDEDSTYLVPRSYRQAIELLQKQKYDEALALLERYLKANPTSPFTQAAELNAGRALEGLERYREAAERYREVVVASNAVAPRLEAMALYRSSFCHEALGEDQLSVAELHDLVSRLQVTPQLLPEELVRAELPARLAGAYARLGNFELDLQNYKQAEAGMNRLRRVRGADGEVPKWFPKTLYFMGRLAARPVTWSDFEAALRPLAHGQGYLLEASDLGLKPWSDWAAHDLMAVYGQMLSVIEKPVVSDERDADPILLGRQIQERQWDRAALIAESLRELQARQSPAPAAEQSPSSVELFAFVEQCQARIYKILASRPAGEGVTPEALARSRGLHGHVLAPDDSLERKFIESGRRRSKKSDDEPPKEPPREPPKELPQRKPKIKEDPNL